MRTLAIINPRSGASDDLSMVASTVRHHPAMDEPDIRITGARDDASLLAGAGARHGFDRIVAVGGDGTLNEVVNGLMELSADILHDVVVGLLPLGTGNDFARSAGIPLDLEDALEAIASFEPRPIDLVRVAGEVEQHLINVSAGGFSGEVDETMTRERKRDWGPLAYLRGALDVLPDPSAYRVDLELEGGEGRTMDALNVVVANGRSVAGGIPVAPEARVDDGLLDVVVVRHAPMSTMAGFGSRCLVGRHLDHDLTEFARVQRVVVRSEPPMQFNLDGERLGCTPLEYTMVPDVLRVLAAPDAPAFGRPGGE